MIFKELVRLAPEHAPWIPNSHSCTRRIRLQAKRWKKSWQARDSLSLSTLSGVSEKQVLNIWAKQLSSSVTFSLPAAQKELEERTKSHDNLRAQYEKLLVSEAASHTKAQAALALEREVQVLRIHQKDAETVPALRARIEELIASNTEYKSRVGALEEERIDITHLRGEELKVLSLTDAASDLQKKVDEMTSTLTRERDRRVGAEALIDNLRARISGLESEARSDRKEAEEKCVFDGSTHSCV